MTMRARSRAAVRLTRAAAVALAVTAVLAPLAAPVAAQQNGKRTVVIDPGHGGHDPGMRGKLPNGARVNESSIALAVSLKLADELKKRGVNVAMTRTKDVFIPLERRGQIANEQRGDLFLSIHVNAVSTTRARGFETYFLAAARTEDERRVEAMENKVVHFETAAVVPPRDPLAFILNDMAQNEHLRESFDLASTVQSIVGPAHPGPDRGVKQADFVVLRSAFMPAVLIEIGFASNPTEAAWLTSASGQKLLAARIADATMEYLGKYERRVTVRAER